MTDEIKNKLVDDHNKKLNKFSMEKIHDYFFTYSFKTTSVFGKKTDGPSEIFSFLHLFESENGEAITLDHITLDELEEFYKQFEFVRQDKDKRPVFRRKLIK